MVTVPTMFHGRVAILPVVAIVAAIQEGQFGFNFSRCSLQNSRSVRTWRQVLLNGSNATKGYGFIQLDNGGKDVFVHISAVERAGLSSLNEGAKVSYEETENRGKTSAENLRVG